MKGQGSQKVRERQVRSREPRERMDQLLGTAERRSSQKERMNTDSRCQVKLSGGHWAGSGALVMRQKVEKE
jgi:hypothetical protein